MAEDADTAASGRLDRREFLSATAIAPLGLRRPAAKPPNILVVLVDDLGFGDLGCYGAEDLRTPNIDRLAAEGMTFERFHANCPVCSPTRAALLTGRYPALVGVPGVIRTDPANSWGYLSPEAVLLPKLLKDAGYATALVGKWHLGLEEPNLPNSRGFDHFHGWLGDMMDDYWSHRRHGINYMRLNSEVIDPRGHASDLFTDWACEYLAGRTDERPFFLYLAYNAPHDPVQPPQEFLDRVHARQPGLTDARSRLAALIEHMDAGVGRVLATLDKTGRRENTLVVFTSDNGGLLRAGARNGPNRAGKTTLYQGGLRVPFVARWPGRIRAGSRSELVALTMDVMPTALEAAGARGPAANEGRSFLRALLGRRQAWPARDLFFTIREGGSLGGRTADAIRRGDLKLLRSRPEGPWELYDLAADPLEARDVASTNAAKVAELLSPLEAYLARSEEAWRRVRDSSRGGGRTSAPSPRTARASW